MSFLSKRFIQTFPPGVPVGVSFLLLHLLRALHEGTLVFKNKITKKGQYGIQIWISKVIDVCGKNFVPICVKKSDVVIAFSQERLLIMVMKSPRRL